MKKLYFCLLLSFFTSFYSRAQLVAGDIAIVGWNSDDNTLYTPGFTDDNIVFVALTFIAAGTQIYFTDLGWTGTGLQSNELGTCAPGLGAGGDGIVRWTATTPLLAGTQVLLNVHFGLTASTGTVTGVLASPLGGTGGPAGVSPSYLNLSTAIDQITAFTGTVASPTLIAAVNYGGGAWGSSLTTCQTTSAGSLNPGAAVGNFSFLFSSTNNDARYTGPLTGNAATLRTNILTSSNWTSANSPSTFSLSGIIFLPVHLLSFDATPTTSGNQLSWRVENEEAFSHYTVQESADGATFADLGKVMATGSTNYSFPAPPVNGKIYYRLKLVDLNGSFEYGKTIVVEGLSADLKVRIYPNPVNSLLRVSAPEPILQVLLMDQSGKVLKTLSPGNATADIDVSNLAPGIYLLKVKTAKTITTQQIHKQ